MPKMWETKYACQTKCCERSLPTFEIAPAMKKWAVKLSIWLRVPFRSNFVNFVKYAPAKMLNKFT